MSRALVRLQDHHRTEAFDCGQPSLNAFLKDAALNRQAAQISSTYVLLDDQNTVIAYYTLAFLAIRSDDTPKSLGRGMPSAIPALLLARLAVDTRAQGQKLGTWLILDALRRACAVILDGPAPIRCVVVDALDKSAHRFYRYHDFTPSPTDPARLFLTYKQILALFEGSEPKTP